ncbi:hypothetical protein GC177_05355 [bacterium]|nr:hypothetical protein [bacterium]
MRAYVTRSFVSRFAAAALCIGMLSACTDRDEAAKAKLAEAKVHMDTGIKATTYAEKAKAYEQANLLLEDIQKHFASTPTAKALAEGQVVDGVNPKEVANQLAIAAPRAVKEVQKQANLLDFDQESAVVKSFFVQEGECHDEPQRVQCLGYSTQISAKVLGNGKTTDAVVVDIKKGGDKPSETAFEGEFLKVYRIDAAKFDALMKSISSGLESSFIQDSLRISGVTAQPDPKQPIYRVVIRSEDAKTAKAPTE